jgi:dipeptidyl aminopeptidase/acylaminoacyl peptidase
VKQQKLYGTWSSPISAKTLSTAIRLNDVQWHGDTLLWVESRGSLGVLVAQTGVDAPRDLTGENMLVKGRVGYGGGEFTSANGHVYFAGNGGRIYRQSIEEGLPRPITPAFGDVASPRVSPDGRQVVYVHSDEGTDGLALVDSDGKTWPRKLAYGTDFVMQPAWNPDGTKLAYIAWDNPNMPWDSTDLRLLTLDPQTMEVLSSEVIAGETAIFQPEFSPDGRILSYISDQSGWGQIYFYDLQNKTHTQITDSPAEHGLPAWNQGRHVYGWTKDSATLYYIRNERGIYSMFRYEVNSRQHTRLDDLSEYTYFEHLSVHDDGTLAMVASSSQIPSRVITYSQNVRVHRRGMYEQIPQENYAKAQPVTWKGHDGENVHGMYYPPTNPRYESEGLPPLIVEIHGGPTSQRMARFEAETQFYTSRGFAFLSVNHRGSTGYGREYMLKLRGNWGYYDVEDAASGAQHLVSQGLADPKKLVIIGGSAGGYTVLQSLVNKPGFYRAAICLYGISDQFMLVEDTHKFEAHYSDSLLGVLPQAADLYRARSPLFHAEKIVDAVIVFQGEDDRVVPRAQSDKIVESLKARGVPHEYHVYAGEGHGFRKPETVEHYTKAVMEFLKRHVVYT